MTEPVESDIESNGDLFRRDENDAFSDPLQARRKAMDYLARREYGRLELQAKLESAGFNAEAASIAVDRLTCEDLQSDRRFIENYIASRVDQGKGPVRIRMDLEERRLEPGLIEEVLADGDYDWTAMARQVREKKFGAAAPGDFREKARQMRFLQYRGFEPGHIRAAVAPRGDE